MGIEREAAPDKIWIDRGPRGGWMHRHERFPDSDHEYVRSDLVEAEIAALRKQVEELRQAISGEGRRMCESVTHGQYCEMAATLHAALEGGRTRAESAEAALKEAVRKSDRARQAVEFVARWTWRTDPPHGNHKLTDTERLSAIKYHPTIKAAAAPHIELAEREEVRHGGQHD